MLAPGVRTASIEAFDKSLELAGLYHVQTELPGILHQSSNVYWLLGEKEEARRRNDEAYRLSTQMHDIRYAIDSLLGMAEFDYDEGKFNQIQYYADVLRKDYEDKGFKYALFYGRMRRILGDVAYYNQDYNEALIKYAEGLALVARHGGYGMYFVDRELTALTKKINALPRETAHHWLNYFRDYWVQHRRFEKTAKLIGWCSRQLARIQLDSGE